jgi:hypothetical protein
MAAAAQEVGMLHQSLESSVQLTDNELCSQESYEGEQC